MVFMPHSMRTLARHLKRRKNHRVRTGKAGWTAISPSAGSVFPLFTSVNKYNDISETEMRRAFIGVACLSLAGLVHAAGSVTLYGVIDNGVAWMSNATSTSGAAGHSVVQTTTGSYGNRWGLRGVEDLGGGTSAIFTLENGFDGFSGKALQGAREFGRQAFVGLSSQTYGTLTMGRQYDIGFEYVSAYTSYMLWAGQYAAHVGDNDTMFSTFRQQNAVKYRTPIWAGLEGSAMYSFSNQPGAFANNRGYSLGLRYTRNSFGAAVAYLHLNNPSAGQTGGTNASGAVGGEYALGASTIFYNAGAVSVQAVTSAAVSYQFGAAQTTAVFTYSDLDYVDQSTLHLYNIEANASYLITPSLLLGASYVYTQGHTSGGRGAAYFQGESPKWHQVNLGVNYFFSKRTTLHLLGVYQKAAGTANEASINATGYVAGTNTTNVKLVMLGLSHKF
ncbi:porin [Caballeronia sp. 15711]|uniref:porin n=1 Tax=Caballeronia sp. 15711 TaxID=3391029 RepID=UPI0039E6E3C0